MKWIASRAILNRGHRRALSFPLEVGVYRVVVFKGGLAAITALAMPLSACTHVLTDRDWSPHVRPSDCEVREVYREGSKSSEGVQYHDARGRIVSRTYRLPYGKARWEDYQYDARGRLIATTIHDEEPGVKSRCYEDFGYAAEEGAVECGNPAIRSIDRIHNKWYSGGRLRRKRRETDKYEAYSLKKQEYVRWLAMEDVTEYAYDDAGRLFTVNASGLNKFEYDAHGRLARTISESSLGSPRRYATTYTYGPDGRIVSHESHIEKKVFHYDGEGRLSRSDVIRNSKLAEYGTWEYDARGATTRYFSVELLYPASKDRPEIRREREYLYFYDDAGRLREIREEGLPVTYTYSGKCDKVKLGPRSPSPIWKAGCTFSSYGVLQACE